MDVAYPVGPKRHNPDQLKYSIRALVKHFPVDRLFLAGHLPGWVSTEQSLLTEGVIHVPVKQDSTKFVNIGRNLEAVLATDISERFLWMNDDFFFLQDFGDDIPLYSRDSPFDLFCTKLLRLTGTLTRPGRPKPDPNFYGYIAGMVGQKEILKGWGIDVHKTINTDAHTPIPIDKQRLIKIIEIVKRDHPQHPIGHFRALYGGALESTPIRDPKIMSSYRVPEAGVPFVSTNGKSWRGELGSWLRAKYDEPTRFEKVE